MVVIRHLDHRASDHSLFGDVLACTLRYWISSLEIISHYQFVSEMYLGIYKEPKESSCDANIEPESDNFSYFGHYHLI